VLFRSEIEQRDLEGLLQAVLRTYRAFYFIPGDLRLIGVEEKPEAVTINLNSSLRMIFPEKGGDEERLQAAEPPAASEPSAPEPITEPEAVVESAPLENEPAGND